jgi:hypothetical protein
MTLAILTRVDPGDIEQDTLANIATPVSFLVLSLFLPMSKKRIRRERQEWLDDRSDFR